MVWLLRDLMDDVDTKRRYVYIFLGSVSVLLIFLYTINGGYHDLSFMTTTTTTTTTTSTKDEVHSRLPPKQTYTSSSSNSNSQNNNNNNNNNNTRIAKFISPLPRTDESLIYNDFHSNQKKYLLYSPSGGWANQLVCLETALEMGRMLNRTVLVPMAARHTNGWGNYDRLDYDSLFEMDRLIDFKFLKSFVPVVPLNVTVRDMRKLVVHSSESLKVIHDDFLVPKMGTEDVRSWGSVQAKVLFITGKGMYHRWFPIPRYVQVRKNIRYSESIRKFALEAANFLGGVGNYNAAHIRRGDYLSMGYTDDAESWVKKLHQSHFRGNTTLYIATEPNNDAQWFRPLSKAFDVKYSKDLPEDIIHKFKRIFPTKTRGDFLGLLEQLICVQADRFLGSGYSTFSSSINFMRKKLNYVFPEIAHLVNASKDQETLEKDEEEAAEELG